MDATGFKALKVIDADTHVIEPADLWTSRLSAKKWGNLIPHVKWDPVIGEEQWYVGDKPIYPVGLPAMAGFDDYAPLHPIRMADIPGDQIDPALRLKKMDEYGVHAAILYPNVGVFAAADYLGMSVDQQFAVDCTKAYNDFLVDFSSTDRSRYIPVMTLPFWDLDETRKEIDRAAALGHKGIVMTQQPDNFGLPPLDHKHWDPLWAQAQDLGLPVNFHIGSGKITNYGLPENGEHAGYAWTTTMNFQGNVRTIAGLIFSGICHRFPRLNFVSVESGIGWIPALLEAMDWQFMNSGVRRDHPDWDLPSEYFKRQIYGCFWFEKESAKAAIEILGPDNFLYETDYPHPTSMSPGPASVAQNPLDFMVESLGGFPDETIAKLVHDNAARIYNL
ncbi:amidohydrolase [Rhodococcus sp. 14C212]|uniref:amidohydrolase family protein n=1 Tax=Rhodococcus sp. 14C212 TaxID=2711209 RepID=UPI0013EB4790|nr:amidohydrolase family protein [Rhodococcus sp. 14C212]NGP06730.1 amidohydrolase [Rhodococcus sp. 14C212]